MTAYLHEVVLGVKHAGAYGLVPVVEADHVKANSLRYCQEKWQHPNRHNLKDCQQRDAHSLNSAPGCHSPEPVKERHSVQAYNMNWYVKLLWSGQVIYHSEHDYDKQFLRRNYKNWKNWKIVTGLQCFNYPQSRLSWSQHFLCLSWLTKRTTFSLCIAAHLTTTTTNCSVSKEYQNVKI